MVGHLHMPVPICTEISVQEFTPDPLSSLCLGKEVLSLCPVEANGAACRVDSRERPPTWAYHVLPPWRPLEPQTSWNHHYMIDSAKDFVQFAGHKRPFPEGNGALGSVQKRGQ